MARWAAGVLAGWDGSVRRRVIRLDCLSTVGPGVGSVSGCQGSFLMETECLRHYNTARPHRALGQLAPAQAGTGPPQIDLAEHRIRRKQVLGGLTYEYQMVA